MPTYEYECTRCQYRFERFQSIKDEPVKRCPKCRCKVRKLLGTGAGIIFKGSGFYQTDYRSKDYHEAVKKEKTAAENASPDSKSSDAGKGAKTESGKTDAARSHSAGT